MDLRPEMFRQMT